MRIISLIIGMLDGRPGGVKGGSGCGPVACRTCTPGGAMRRKTRKTRRLGPAGPAARRYVVTVGLAGRPDRSAADLADSGNVAWPGQPRAVLEVASGHGLASPCLPVVPPGRERRR